MCGCSRIIDQRTSFCLQSRTGKERVCYASNGSLRFISFSKCRQPLNYHAGALLLGHGLQLLDAAVAFDKGERAIIAADARHRVIGDYHIEALLLELLAGVFDQVLGLCGEAYSHEAGKL